MEITYLSFAYLLGCLAVTTVARSTARSTAPDALSIHASLADDPKLKIPPRVPYDIPPTNPSETRSVRVTSYSAPHISSFNLIPCLFDMVSTAYASSQVNKVPLDDKTYTCQKNRLELQVKSTAAGPMEYGDLMVLADSIVSFQQTYILPGLDYEFRAGGTRVGYGWLRFMYADEARGENATAVATS